MQTIQLHPNLPAFSRLVYGAWRMNDAGTTTPEQALARIEAALDAGITTFDHADVYGGHTCEALFGEALKLSPGIKARTQHITKCDIMIKGAKFPARRVKHYDTSPAHIRASVDASLRYLGLDVIDVLLIHRPDPLMDATSTGECLDALVKEGKIRAAGVSNFMVHDFNLLQSAMQTPLVTNQIEISLLARQSFSDGTLSQAQQLKHPPMAWSPLAGGKLFAHKALQPLLGAMAQASSVGTDAVAIAWLLAHPADILPVLGTNNLERIKASADAFKVKMDREAWFELLVAAQGHDVA